MVTLPFTVKIPVEVWVREVFEPPATNVNPVQVLVLLMVYVLLLLTVTAPKSVVPVPLMVLVIPVNVVAGEPVMVPPLLSTLPDIVNAYPEDANVPLSRLRSFNDKAVPSVAVPEALLMVKLL